MKIYIQTWLKIWNQCQIFVQTMPELFQTTMPTDIIKCHLWLLVSSRMYQVLNQHHRVACQVAWLTKSLHLGSGHPGLIPWIISLHMSPMLNHPASFLSACLFLLPLIFPAFQTYSNASLYIDIIKEPSLSLSFSCVCPTAITLFQAIIFSYSDSRGITIFDYFLVILTVRVSQHLTYGILVIMTVRVSQHLTIFSYYVRLLQHF